MGLYLHVGRSDRGRLCDLVHQIESDSSSGLSPRTLSLAGNLLRHLHYNPTAKRDDMLERFNATRYRYDQALKYLRDKGLYTYRRRLLDGFKHVDDRHPIVGFVSTEPMDCSAFPPVPVAELHPAPAPFKPLIDNENSSIFRPSSATDLSRISSSPPGSSADLGGQSDDAAWEAWDTPSDAFAPPAQEPAFIPETLMSELDPNLDDARTFLDVLGRSVGGVHAFRSFDDTDLERPELARTWNGTLDRVLPDLIDQQEQGAGVYVSLNETDGRGFKAESVTRIRAFALDLDEGGEEKLKRVMGSRRLPHLVTETSPGKFHAVWLVDGAPIERGNPELEPFRLAQHALAELFGGDRKVCDLPRVFRIPGFLHCKGEPFRSRLMFVGDHKPFQYDDMARALRLDERRAKLTEPRKTTPVRSPRGQTWTARGVSQGGRNNYVFRVTRACLHNGGDRETALSRAIAAAEACSPPLPRSEALAAARSAIRCAGGR